MLESGQARGRGIQVADFLWRFFYPSILKKNGLIPHLQQSCPAAQKGLEIQFLVDFAVGLAFYLARE